MRTSNSELNKRQNTRSETRHYKYDAAVSYDSHSRELVRKVVAYLKSDKHEVFFDLDKKSELLSEPLEPKLYQIYQNESLVNILFVTDAYLKNKYTLLEARRSFISAEQNCRKLIIVNFLGKDLPEPYNEYAYLDGSLPADEIAYMIDKRIKELKEECYECYNSPDDKIYIETIQKIEHNNGIVTGSNAVIHDVSFHK